MRAEKVGILATASVTCEPWAAAVHFLVDQDLNFYFLTRKSTLKYKNAMANGKASFNVGLMSGGKNGNFQIAGRIKQLRGDADWCKLMLEVFSQRQLNDLHMDARKDDPFFGMKGHDFVVLVLKPKYVRWLKIVKGMPKFENVLS
jgi:hypothetical protein